MIAVRGPRQFGKSTWLEQQVAQTIQQFGGGSAFYLNGDLLAGRQQLMDAVQELLPLYRPGAPVRRLFIDEITAIADWTRGIKALADGGLLREILLVTTGSKATDLRRGVERLPGRKGRLDRTTYLFCPISYTEFLRVCGGELKDRTLDAYMLSGGSPVACAHLAEGGLPEYVIEIVKDWILGECAASGRSRSSLLALLQCLYRFGGNPVGQAKIARELGMANNTVAAGYLELLADLMVVSPAFAWDLSRGVAMRRKEAKQHFSNTLVALAWHPAQLRSVDDWASLPSEMKGPWLEWVVAQELLRRAAIAGDEVPEQRAYWQSREHELDFVLPGEQYLEVKHGRTSPLEFSWFPKLRPKGRLTVISQSRFDTDRITGITLEDFLRQQP